MADHQGSRDQGRVKQQVVIVTIAPIFPYLVSEFSAAQTSTLVTRRSCFTIRVSFAREVLRVVGFRAFL